MNVIKNTVLFDLDGTLLDTPDFILSMNLLLSVDKPLITESENEMVTNGSEV